MIPGAADPASQNDAKQREQLLDAIARLRGNLRTANADIRFSDVRENYPELAHILFSGRDLRHADLRGADLRNIDFRGSDLSGCDFSDARIAGARFERAKVARPALQRSADWTAYRASWEPDSEFDTNLDGTGGFFRAPGERFSLSPFLPELVILSLDSLSDPGLLDKTEQLALEAGRLALAVRGLTNREVVLLASPEHEAEADDEIAARPGYVARSYCHQLTTRVRSFGLPMGTEVRLPSYRMLHALGAFYTPDLGTEFQDFSTDLAVADLRLGRNGAEFVLAGDGGDLALFTAEPAPERGGRPRHAERAGNRHALVRPMFLLGGHDDR